MKLSMVQTKIFSLVMFSIISCAGMDNPRQQWVQAARDIHVKTSLKQINDRLGITDNSTILDVKRSIANLEGIEVSKQSLYALYSQGIFRLNEMMSEQLPDNQNIKSLMSLYNTRRFLLVIHLNGPFKG